MGLSLGWVETGSADDATATATRAAATGKQHVLYSVDASYSVTNSGLLQIKDGTDVIAEYYVYDGKELIFPQGVTITKGNAVSAELAASGTPGQLGKVNIHGITL